MPQQPPLRVLLGVALIAGGTLALQVLLTRIFSAVLFYHFGFLAISLALLGIGAGALAIYVRPGLVEGRSAGRVLALSSVAFAVLLPLVAAVLVRIDYTYTEVTFGFAARLGLACLLAVLPFLAAGVALAVAIRTYTPWIGRVYAFDLAGAALGAAAVVPLLWWVDAPTLLVALGGAGALAALLFAGADADRRVAAAALGLVVLATALAGATEAYYLKPEGPEPKVERWTPISRITAYDRLGGSPNGLIAYDRVIGEIVPYERGTTLPDWRRTQEGPQSVGYLANGPGGHTLIIGGGGGRDILTALSEGQRVDVIELNRRIREVVDEDLGDFSGAPYSLPGVSTDIGDGRSTLAERDTSYDQIHLGFTDTYSANSAQAFALTENNLYTVEAFEEYFEHLRPDGILNVSRPHRENGNEALRATALALEGLRRAGVEDPKRHVVVLLGTYSNPFNTFRYGTVLAKRTPFTAYDLNRVIRPAARERSEGIAFAPGGPYVGEWADLARAPTPEAFCEKTTYDLCPPTDDRPFFFNIRRLEDLGSGDTRGSLSVPDPVLVLVLTLAVLLALSSLAFVLPLWLVRKEGRPPAGSLLFFAAIGLGYLVLEIALIQRFVLFLGFPTYALSVVLFSLLLFTGLGAYLSSRGTGDPRRRLVATLAGGSALIVVAAFGLQPLLRELIELPFAARVAATVAMLAPVGVLLGMAMPLGLARIDSLHPGAVTWAWAINGIASVVASALAVVVALEWGFDAATLVAAAGYVGALVHAWRGAWPPARSAS
jgi:spermidine synthase